MASPHHSASCGYIGHGRVRKPAMDLLVLVYSNNCLSLSETCLPFASVCVVPHRSTDHRLLWYSLRLRQDRCILSTFRLIAPSASLAMTLQTFHLKDPLAEAPSAQSVTSGTPSIQVSRRHKV